MNKTSQILAELEVEIAADCNECDRRRTTRTNGAQVADEARELVKALVADGWSFNEDLRALVCPSCSEEPEALGVGDAS